MGIALLSGSEDNKNVLNAPAGSLEGHYAAGSISSKV